MTDPRVETPSALLVFEHSKRREWGLAILAWETRHKRAYLFENGQLRVLAEDFYQMMREVDRPQDEIHALYACLKRDLQAARAEQGLNSPLAARSTPAAMSFDEQLTVFRAEYTGGFEGVQWKQMQRGAEAPKRLAGHRDIAIQQAQAKLGAPELEARIAGQQFRAICDDVLTVLRSTDLVPGAELALLKTEDAEHRRSLAIAVVDLLHGKAGFGTRFERFISSFEQTFSRSASWQLATALPALVHPAEHVCVHPTSFREQAKWMAPRLALPKLPTAVNYLRALAMAKLVSSRLTDHAESPQDLMDVHDFMRITTRPAAKKLLVTLKRETPSPKTAAKRADAEAQTV